MINKSQKPKNRSKKKSQNRETETANALSCHYELDYEQRKNRRRATSQRCMEQTNIM